MVTSEKKIRKLRRVELFDIVNLTLLTVICLTMFYPFLNLFFVSISAQSEVTAANGLLLYPKKIQLEAYKYVFTYNNIWRAYQNTIFTTVVGTILSLLLTCMGGYSLSRRGMPGRTVMTNFVLITMFISGGLIPTYLTMRDYKLLNSLWVLILPGCVSAWNLFLARNFFMGIPEDLKEACYIDGGNEVQTMLRIVLPLSMPIIATLTLFYGLGYWNQYSSAIIYNTRQEYHVLQVVVRRMYSSSMSDLLTPEELELQRTPPTEVVRAATVMFTTAPVLAIYPFLQKHFAQGVMVGSLKG